jgi:hypothetical protein
VVHIHARIASALRHRLGPALDQSRKTPSLTVKSASRKSVVGDVELRERWVFSQSGDHVGVPGGAPESSLGDSTAGNLQVEFSRGREIKGIIHPCVCAADYFGHRRRENIECLQRWKPDTRMRPTKYTHREPNHILYVVLAGPTSAACVNRSCAQRNLCKVN